MKTRQQELELLAEWLGVDLKTDSGGILCRLENPDSPYCKWMPWNPLTNDTDFLNMVAGKQVDIEWHDDIECVIVSIGDILDAQNYDNDKVAAMKHAAYQVCLMAAKAWKEKQ